MLFSVKQKINFYLLIILCAFLSFGAAAAEATAHKTLSELYNLPDGNAYVSTIQSSQEIDEGIELTLGEIILDQEQLIFSVILSGDLPTNSFNFDLTAEINCEGEVCGFAAGPEWFVPSEDKSNAIMGIVKAELFLSDPNTIPDEIQGNLTIGEMEIRSKITPEDPDSLTRSYTIQGPWTFAFSADKTAIKEDTRRYEISNQFSVDGNDYEIVALVASPVSQHITLTSNSDPNFIGYITVRPDDGEEIPFFLRSTRSGYMDPYSTSTYEIFKSPEGERSMGNYFPELSQAETLTLTPWLSDLAVYPEKTYLDTEPLREFQVTVPVLP